jgi:Uma2 family endonuclease
MKPGSGGVSATGYPFHTMSQSAKRRATYADVLASPENMRAEVIDGELYLQPRPRRRHLRVGSGLGGFLFSAFDLGSLGPGGWVLLVEPELHLGAEPDILVPDLAAWREERYPGEVDDDDAFFTDPPDWVCEILSQTTARVDRMKKVPIYARSGIAHVWIVDPRDRIVEALRLKDGGYVLAGTFGGEAPEVAIEPFDAVPIPAAALWGRNAKLREK